MHSGLESELVVQEHFYLITFIRFDERPGRLAVHHESGSPMAICRAPCDGDGQIVGSCLCLNASENTENEYLCKELGHRRHFGDTVLRLKLVRDAVAT